MEKCCYFLPLDLGCLILGYFTSVFSLALGAYSTVLLVLERSHPNQGAQHLKLVTHLELDSSAVKIILSIINMVQILWMFFSIMLILGIKKNRASFVLSYFSYGIVVTIMMLLGALLVMLNGHWLLALFCFIAAMLYMHFLTAVHVTYELMQRGKIFGLNQHQVMEEDDELINPSL